MAESGKVNNPTQNRYIPPSFSRGLDYFKFYKYTNMVFIHITYPVCGWNCYCFNVFLYYCTARVSIAGWEL